MTREPELYYRTSETGAAVFAVDVENRNRRTELRQIATVNLRNDKIKPHGQHELSATETAAIERWMAERRIILTERALENVLRTVDHLNLTAAWAQKQATPKELERVTDALLMAMHDLRCVLVRKAPDETSGDV